MPQLQLVWDAPSCCAVLGQGATPHTRWNLAIRAPITSTRAPLPSIAPGVRRRHFWVAQRELTPLHYAPSPAHQRPRASTVPARIRGRLTGPERGASGVRRRLRKPRRASITHTGRRVPTSWPRWLAQGRHEAMWGGQAHAAPARRLRCGGLKAGPHDVRRPQPDLPTPFTARPRPCLPRHAAAGAEVGQGPAAAGPRLVHW